MKKFAGKTTLVTGASSGIGEALARNLAKRGSHLIITARSANKLEALATELRQSGVNVHVFPGDLSDPAEPQRLFQAVEDAGLTVDLLINNAGFGKWGELLSVAWEEYTNLLQLNINSLTELCYLFIPGMLARGSGGVINVGSTASFVPVPYAAVYSASKAYVIMFTEALHGEYGERGLQVMTLCPGGTATNFAAVASNGNADSPASSTSDSPEAVAEEGIAAYEQGELVVITGRSNKIIGFLPRLLPRRRVVKMVGDRFKQVAEGS